MKLWAKMTWEEIERLSKKNTLVILPLGSVEQHGQRLPVITDILFANHWAKQVAERIENSVLLPSQNYGMSWHHTAFSGTISINTSVYALLIREILESVLEHGFRKILIVNGHGGNHDPIERAIAEIQENYPDAEIQNPMMDIVKEIDASIECDENFVHAGSVEVSTLYAIAPKILRDSSVVTNVPLEAKFGQGTKSPTDWEKRFPKGQKGNQKNCSAQLGEQVHAFVIKRLLETAKQIME